MIDIDLRLLRHFVVLTTENSFTRSAEVLAISQPALSQSIQRLEAIVGATLIDRQPGRAGLTLTPAGESLRRDACDLLTRGQRALRRAQQTAKSAPRQRLHVGFGTSTPRELTRVALRVAQDAAAFELVLDHVPWGTEEEWLSSGRGDALFVQSAGTSAPDDWDVLPLGERQRVAVFAAGHRLATRSSVTLSDLAAEPIVDAASDRDYWLALQHRGDAPKVVGPPARTVEEMLALVSAGVGMAITSETVAANNGNRELVFVPIEDLEPVRVGLATVRGDDRAHLRSFVDAMAHEGH